MSQTPGVFGTKIDKDTPGVYVLFMSNFFPRAIFSSFQIWLDSTNSKPLIVRGARQVGKTFAVKAFAEKVGRRLVYLNLELEKDKELFSEVSSANDCLQTIELNRSISIDSDKDIIFIDEIQNSKQAMAQLRFFYEERPEIKVIAAGSLLEVIIKKGGFQIPVGRVDYLFMHPCSFNENLLAHDNKTALEILKNIDLKNLPSQSIHTELKKKYSQFAAVGGMPEAVSSVIEDSNLSSVNEIHQGLINGYMDDVFKYTKGLNASVVRFVIDKAPEYSGKAIKYEGFANSKYKSREISQAIQNLESARVLSRSYPSSSFELPVESNYRRAPKLFFLDSGLVTSKSNIMEQVFKSEDLNSHFKGRFAEQLVFQSLKKSHLKSDNEINYWLRDRKNSSAEVDFLYQFEGSILPIEVKSGTSGTLKSLNQFIKESSTSLAIRVWDKGLQVDEIKTENKICKLLSIPFYLLERMDELISSEI